MVNPGTRSPNTRSLRLTGLHTHPIELDVFVVSNWFGRMRGLSFKKSIPADGLLFLFDRPSRYPFWMWGMRLPIDLIWVRGGQVIGWEENCEPPRSWWHLIFPYFLRRYKPDQAVDVVLEVGAGSCRRWGMDKSREMRVEICCPL